MPWPKGKPRPGQKPPANPGRRAKGVPNKFNADVKAMILAALDKAGGPDYLHRQSEQNPGPFMALVGKVLPMQITGEGGGALVMRWETGDKPASDDA
jgi:hypothetical protein